MKILYAHIYNYKIPTSGEYKYGKRHTNLDLCPEGGVGLDIDRCITCKVYYCMCDIRLIVKIAQLIIVTCD